jgi:hypothetical protein
MNGVAQGCQMVYFQTKYPNMGKFWSVLQWKMLVNFMSIWSFFTAILVYLSRFGMLCQGKSGNPGEADGLPVVSLSCQAKGSL